MSIEQGASDYGAQIERTALAWTRTGLALLLAVVVTSRLAVKPLGVGILVFDVIAIPVAIAIVVLARRRYGSARSALRAGRPLPDGKLPALATAVTLLLAILEITYGIAG